MRLAVLILSAVWLFASLAHAGAQSISSCARLETSGERTLCHEATLDAPVAEVWRLWTTPEGLQTWAAPVAAIDARPGGVFESAYGPNGRVGAPGNIRNRIIAATPNALLIMQVASAPPGFAHEDEIRQIVTMIEMTPIDATHTHVRVSMLGYRDGAAFDDLYRFFERGNAWSLQKLQQRIASGPIDWRAEAAPGTR